MKMLLGGKWVDRDDKIEVRNPFDGSVVDTVPRSDLSDVEEALATAERGAAVMRGLTGYERYEILMKVADLMRERADDLARTITLEEGKILGRGADRGDPRARNHRVVGGRGEAPRRRSDPARRRPGRERQAGLHPARGRAGWWSASARSTSRCTWCATRWDRRSPPAIPASSSRPPTRRCPPSS